MEPKICRTCLHNNGSISLFCESSETKICAKIMRLTGIIIDKYDGLPSHICTACESDLNVACNYINKCEESEKILREKQYNIVEFDNGLMEIKTEQIDDYDSSQFLDSQEDSAELPEKEVEAKTRSKSVKSRRKKVEAKISCEVCGRKVVCQSALAIHMRVHTGEKPFECEKCDKRFATKSQVKLHLNAHLKIRKQSMRPKKLKCLQCGKLCQGPSALKTHSLSHSGERPYQCTQCPKQFRYQGGLKNHFEANHCVRERKYICDYCNVKFYSKATLIRHLYIHTDFKPYLCAHCPQRFRQQSALIRHTRCHTGERPYSCTICGKCFPCNSSLRHHKVKHTDEANYKCDECGKMFKSKERLRCHGKIHKHKSLVCNCCGMQFTWKGCLDAHVRRVHSERSGHCEVCFKQVSDLEVHMRKHTGEKPFPCDECDSAFSTALSLKLHKTFKHAEGGKYECAYGGCTKTFPIPSMLEYHVLKYHTHSTPHVCKHCNKGFFRMCDLNRHLRANHSTSEQIKKSPKE